MRRLIVWSLITINYTKLTTAIINSFTTASFQILFLNSQPEKAMKIIGKQF